MCKWTWESSCLHRSVTDSRVLFFGPEVGCVHGCDGADGRCVNDAEMREVAQRSMLASRKRYTWNFS